MMHFRLKEKTGSHVEPQADGTLRKFLAKDGEIIASPQDLVKAFPNKFERVNSPPEPVEVDEDEEEEGDVANPLGNDVSERFTRAAEAGVRVLQDGGAFYVVDIDRPDTPLHDKPLKKARVTPFIKKYAGI